MAIYHQITWNFDADPDAIEHCIKFMDNILHQYFADGSTIPQDNYWEPPRPPADPLPTEGSYHRLRLWGELASCEEFINQVNAWRKDDPVAATVISEATIFST